jgi:GT2 family glycosyltransferase
MGPVSAASPGEPVTGQGAAPLLSVGASIVLYRTHVSRVTGLVGQLLAQGAARVYLVDNSPPEFDAFSGWTPPERVSVIRTGRNLGYGGGNNLAIADSVRLHEYHLICNPDIELGPGTLPGLVEAMATHPRAVVCMPRVIGTDGALHYLCKRSPLPLDYVATVLSGTRWGARRRARLEMRDRDYDREMTADCLSGCFMFFRSRVLQELGGFDDGYFLYFEDFDLSRRASAKGENLYVPGVHVVHGHGRAHAHSLKLRFVFLRSALRYFSKWGWFAVRPVRRQ